MSESEIRIDLGAWWKHGCNEFVREYGDHLFYAEERWIRAGFQGYGSWNIDKCFNT